MGQSLSPAVLDDRCAQRLDRTELWRIADRAARHAEARVPQRSAALLQAGTTTPDVQEALALRQRANELLRAALGDVEHGGCEASRSVRGRSV